MTRLFLAALYSRYYQLEQSKPPYVLESYHYLLTMNEPNLKIFMDYVLSDQCKMFLLDSGAFTYLSQIKSNSKTTIDFDKYLEDYAKFINKYDIKYFFELDIDAVVGIKKVEQMRRKLERMTGKKCIPVFHKSRGKDYWLKMIKEYDYVALGGIAIKDFKRSEHKMFKWFIDTAHAEGTKIHGLGYTSNKGLIKYPFDTVDSTSWLGAGRFGNLDVYDPVQKKLVKFKPPKNSKTIKGFYKKADIIAVREWIKYGKHLEKMNGRKVLSWHD